MKSIYIHIPFCKTICTYCDFCKFYYNQTWVNDYLDSLNKELNSIYQGGYLDTIYIGGGTPNALSNDELEKLFNILKPIKKSNNYEFTIECNIEYITEEQLQIFKNNGVNRLSIGIQTFNSKYIKLLGRHHTKNLVVDKIKLVKQYFNNINIDLMYALPNETIKELERDLKFFLSLDVPHISTYSLMLEPHTILYNQNIKPIDEGLDALMYQTIINTLEYYGYEHYEISNFSKQGFESRHNLTYWNNNHYYGLGLGASGYINNIRYDNTKTLNEYLKGNYVNESIKMDFNTNLENAFILGLRKMKGIEKEDFNKKYQVDINELDVIKMLLKEKKLIDDGNNIFIPQEYLYLSNDILIEFLGVDYEKYCV